MDARNSKISNTSLISLPKVIDINGSISVVQNQIEIPFDVNRIYYLYDIPSGSERGGHAHIELQQLIIAACGSFDIRLDDGNNKTTIHLNRPNIGLLMPAGLWRELDNFSSGSICLVLASHTYAESDYIRDYSEFLSFKTLNQ